MGHVVFHNKYNEPSRIWKKYYLNQHDNKSSKMRDSSTTGDIKVSTLKGVLEILNIFTINYKI